MWCSMHSFLVTFAILIIGSQGNVILGTTDIVPHINETEISVVNGTENSTLLFEEAEDPCTPNPCNNGGSCNLDNGKATCLCKEPFYGDHCEEECSCENGKCAFVEGVLICVCDAEYGYYKDRICKACECGKGANCTFDPGMLSDGKLCICPKGFKEDKQVCIALSRIPRDLKAAVVRNVSLICTWGPPEDRATPIKRYDVEWKGPVSIGKAQTPFIFYNIRYLWPYTYYTVKVRVSSPAGTEPWSEGIRIRTGIGVPPAPSGLAVTSSNRTSLSLIWNWPVPDVGPIQHFELQWEDDYHNTILSPLPLKTYYTINGLMPCTNYSVRVRAATEAGSGQWSEEVFGSTFIRGGGCISKYCFNGGTCTETSDSDPWCFCKTPFFGERCERGNGDDGFIDVSRQIILISVISAVLVVLATIAACMVFCCVRSRKAS